MTKLTDQKIRWIIRAKMKEILSTNEIALLQNVSGSRIRQIWRQYRNTMTVPILAKPGRPSRSITNEEISAVIGTHKEYPCSAVVLETILENRHGIKIPHNRIHKILKSHRLASNDTNKQRRRKWVKYERTHSMSLWHTDWYLTSVTLSCFFFVYILDLINLCRNISDGVRPFIPPCSLVSLYALTNMSYLNFPSSMVIFSNAALHWVHDHTQVFQHFWDMLNCDCTRRRQILIQCGGYGNLRVVLMLLRRVMKLNEFKIYFAKMKQPWYFAKPDDTDKTLYKYQLVLHDDQFQLLVSLVVFVIYFV